MSIYAQIGMVDTQQIASNQGWGGFSSRVDRLDPVQFPILKNLVEEGITEQPQEALQELIRFVKTASLDYDMKEVAEAVQQNLETAGDREPLLITNGVQMFDGRKTNPRGYNQHTGSGPKTGDEETSGGNGSQRDEVRLGRCYELAGKYVMGHADASLVHGSIQGLGHPRIGHSWAKLTDGKVWEPVTNKEWKSVVFKAFFNPKEEHVYPRDEVIRETIESETWGPWEPAEYKALPQKATG